ncbi:hypothetical protein DFJ73DRAFT_823000 [Zopfochytrium polystomum]|nr:hypothetical protein DFJ73DRAFT_823000 [Zopfochytrium polystomum]
MSTSGSIASHIGEKGAESATEAANDSTAVPYFLAAAFDPQKATIAELRSILSSCEVQPPNTRANKEEFVKCFREKVAANAETFIQNLAKVQPSSDGITVVSLEPIGNSERERSKPRARKLKPSAAATSQVAAAKAKKAFQLTNNVEISDSSSSADEESTIQQAPSPPKPESQDIALKNVTNSTRTEDATKIIRKFAGNSKKLTEVAAVEKMKNHMPIITASEHAEQLRESATSIKEELDLSCIPPLKVKSSVAHFEKRPGGIDLAPKQEESELATKVPPSLNETASGRSTSRNAAESSQARFLLLDDLMPSDSVQGPSPSNPSSSAFDYMSAVAAASLRKQSKIPKVDLGLQKRTRPEAEDENSRNSDSLPPPMELSTTQRPKKVHRGLHNSQLMPPSLPPPPLNPQQNLRPPSAKSLAIQGPTIQERPEFVVPINARTPVTATGLSPPASLLDKKRKSPSPSSARLRRAAGSASVQGGLRAGPQRIPVTFPRHSISERITDVVLDRKSSLLNSAAEAAEFYDLSHLSKPISRDDERRPDCSIEGPAFESLNPTRRLSLLPPALVCEDHGHDAKFNDERYTPVEETCSTPPQSPVVGNSNQIMFHQEVPKPSQGLSPRRNAKLTVQPMGSPLLTKTLKARLQRFVEDGNVAVKSPGADAPASVESPSKEDKSAVTTEVVKLVESDSLDDIKCSGDAQQTSNRMDGWKSMFIYSILFILVPCVGITVIWWREYGHQIRFCDGSRAVDFPPSMRLLQGVFPVCVPCPHWAMCSDREIVACADLGQSIHDRFPRHSSELQKLAGPYGQYFFKICLSRTLPTGKNSPTGTPEEAELENVEFERRGGSSVVQPLFQHTIPPPSQPTHNTQSSKRGRLETETGSSMSLQNIIIRGINIVQENMRKLQVTFNELSLKILTVSGSFTNQFWTSFTDFLLEIHQALIAFLSQVEGALENLLDKFDWKEMQRNLNFTVIATLFLGIIVVGILIGTWHILAAEANHQPTKESAISPKLGDLSTEPPSNETFDLVEVMAQEVLKELPKRLVEGSCVQKLLVKRLIFSNELYQETLKSLDERAQDELWKQVETRVCQDGSTIAEKWANGEGFWHVVM